MATMLICLNYEERMGIFTLLARDSGFGEDIIL
jgi:hypothetical protein